MVRLDHRRHDPNGKAWLGGCSSQANHEAENSHDLRERQTPCGEVYDARCSRCGNSTQAKEALHVPRTSCRRHQQPDTRCTGLGRIYLSPIRNWPEGLCAIFNSWCRQRPAPSQIDNTGGPRSTGRSRPFGASGQQYQDRLLRLRPWPQLCRQLGTPTVPGGRHTVLTGIFLTSY
jgi:hypothetical protein